MSLKGSTVSGVHLGQFRLNPGPKNNPSLSLFEVAACLDAAPEASLASTYPAPFNDKAWEPPMYSAMFAEADLSRIGTLGPTLGISGNSSSACTFHILNSRNVKDLSFVGFLTHNVQRSDKKEKPEISISVLGRFSMTYNAYNSVLPAKSGSYLKFVLPPKGHNKKGLHGEIYPLAVVSGPATLYGPSVMKHETFVASTETKVGQDDRNKLLAAQGHNLHEVFFSVVQPAAKQGDYEKVWRQLSQLESIMFPVGGGAVAPAAFNGKGAADQRTLFNSSLCRTQGRIVLESAQQFFSGRKACVLSGCSDGGEMIVFISS